MNNTNEVVKVTKALMWRGFSELKYSKEEKKLFLSQQSYSRVYKIWDNTHLMSVTGHESKRE